MRKTFLPFLFILLSCYLLQSQLTHYTDRATWNALTTTCFEENFTSSTDAFFTEGNLLQLNGFTLEANGISPAPFSNFRFNQISGSSNLPDGWATADGNHAKISTNATGNSHTVDLIFDNPVSGFFADFHAPNNYEVLELVFYNEYDIEIGTYNFGPKLADCSEQQLIPYGFRSITPVAKILFRSLNANGTNDICCTVPGCDIDYGEITNLDNVEIDCSIIQPIPTLSQWGIITLAIVMMILGVVGVKNRKLIFG